MRIDKVWIDDHAVYAATTDGLMASYDFSRWPSLGRVVAADGKMYASVESATNAGTTALAVIAYKNQLSSLYTAIAISDESSKMNWDAAKTACEGKTPTLSGANWVFPDKDQWRLMFAANGGEELKYTGLNTLITTAGVCP